ncbi:hypothetical protein JOC85_001131 [Bacillus mesophilus]|uniref:Uncharacterized protein n=1 Tax=Bacillus mesophilus TaxID=1808955 RepID=A0A6M0Q4D2_9BACI|nr:hypothetical protein [Bacillus mesophilus]MBM7660364.1 hypothetical protein [Bacillus mesophilus]NEY71073.1 hypothetical protein [Bacillus mesophilus]
MNSKQFVEIYEAFLSECHDKGWTIDIIEPSLRNHIASITNQEGMEVQFTIEVDFDNYQELYGSTKQSMMNYGILKPEGDDDSFAKEVKYAFEAFMERHASKQS